MGHTVHFLEHAVGRKLRVVGRDGRISCSAENTIIGTWQSARRRNRSGLWIHSTKTHQRRVNAGIAGYLNVLLVLQLLAAR